MHGKIKFLNRMCMRDMPKAKPWGVREETISLPEWDVHAGYAEGEALGVGRGLCPILAYPLVGTVGR